MSEENHVLITGRPGIGKTTLIKKIISYLNKKEISIEGFYTEEIRENQNENLTYIH